MNKKLFLYGIALALFVLLVNSAFALQATNIVNPSDKTPGEAVSWSLTLTDADTGNTDNVTALTAATVPAGSLVLKGVTDSTKTIPVVFNFGAGTVVDEDAIGLAVTATATVPSDLTYVGQAYSGTFKISGTEGAATDETSTFVLSATVKSPLEVQVYDNSASLEVLGEEGQSGLTKTFNVKNVGTTSLSGLTFDTSALDLTDGGESITLTFSTLGAINAGETKTVTITANFEENINVDTYGGILSVKSGTTVLDTFKLDLVVHPEMCTDGIISNGVADSRSTADLEIDVRNPDNGDDFRVGEDMTVEVKVTNDGSDDLDVSVEVILYNLDQDEEVTSFEADSQEIKDGNSETFEFDLAIPRSSDLDDEDSYVLFVKAFEDGGEDDNCNWDSVSLDFKREKDDVVVSSIQFLPSTLKAGEVVDIKVDVTNEGTKDQKDATIRLVNSELGLSLVSTEFDLDKSGDSNDDISKRFTFTIPTSAVAKQYLIEVSVLDDNGDVYENGQEFETLTVTGEGSSTKNTLGVKSLNTELSTGSSTVNLVVSNPEKTSVVGTVEFTAVGDWADSATKVVSLQSGDNTIAFDLNVKPGMSGVKSATVNVKTPSGNDFATQSFSLSFNVKGSEVATESLFSGDNSTLFWILGDIVLVIVAIFFIRAIFFGRKTQ